MMRSLQRELNDFYGKILGEDYSIQQVTKGALSQSRAKLHPEAFSELNSEAARTFYEQAPYRQWKGHRLLASVVYCLIIKLPVKNLEYIKWEEMQIRIDAWQLFR